MTENMKKFLEAVSMNEEMREKLAKVTEKEEIIARAAELGFELTAADFEQNRELSDDELDAVAGGACSICACMAAGGGGGDDRDGDIIGCACVGYGQGGDAKDDHFICACFLTGAGGGYDDWKEEIIARAAELGIELTNADFKQNRELSDDELDAVAGSKGSACACIAAGGGGH